MTMAKRILKVYPNHKTARDAFIAEFRKKIPGNQYKVPSLIIIEGITQNEIRYASAETPERYRGCCFDGVIISEPVPHDKAIEFLALVRPSD